MGHWNIRSISENSAYLRHHGAEISLFAATAVFIGLYIWQYRKGRKLPPGPMGIPIFGYYFSLINDPVKKLSEVAKKYGNVVSFYIGPKCVVILNDWDALKEGLSLKTTLYRPPSLFEQVPYNFGVAGANGPEWVETRRLSSRAIKDMGLNKASWEDLIQEEVLELVERISKEGEKPVDVRAFFAESFVNNIITLILGERLQTGHQLTKLVTEAVDAILQYTPTLGMINFSETLSKILQVFGVEKENLLFEKVHGFGKFISDTVDERMLITNQESGESFIGRFKEEIQNNQKNKQSSFITVDALKGNVIALLTGGGETTRSTVIWTLIAMAEHPDKQRKVQAELDSVIGKEGSMRYADRFKIPYTFATLLESMRYTTLAPFSAMRMAVEDLQLQGYHIPKGTFIITNNWTIHNDPRYWNNPEQFKPERFLLEGGKKVNHSPDSYNPFSYGKRNCPGKLLALMEDLQYFVILMQKFKVMPKNGNKVEFDAILGLTFQPLNAHLRFIPR